MAPNPRALELLNQLKKAVANLPMSIPEGDPSGPIATYLSDFSIDKEEGPFYSFNRAWERAFQQPEDERRKLIVRGKYGLQVAVAFVAYFLQAEGIEEHNAHNLVADRIENLLQLIHDV